LSFARRCGQLARRKRRALAAQVECLSSTRAMEGRNLVYAAPTSGGKSLVAEVLAVRALVRQERRVLVVEPYVAIVEEKVQMLRELLA